VLGVFALRHGTTDRRKNPAPMKEDLPWNRCC
jgi:hypothetical protein